MSYRLWKTCCQLKHKIFFWMLVHNRLNTRAMLHRKNFFFRGYTCVLCGLQVLETRDHLFFHCPFYRICWTYLAANWAPTYQGIQHEINNLKEMLDLPFSLEIIILAAWAIWITRNEFIFNKITPSLYRCRKTFKEELKWLVHRATREEYANLEQWAHDFK